MKGRNISPEDVEAVIAEPEQVEPSDGQIGVQDLVNVSIEHLPIEMVGQK
ncbi:MAG: hypothetical protein KatS3mg082_1535 [Nitrospiraceae bacterium]|jgi:hypothetical protein|nr:MAG: hypothetical protein KatS3mg082_1535 [Nitrospiraceae bacterium]